MLLKIIIVLILVGYVFNKVTSFLFRGANRNYQGRDQFGQQYSRKPRNASNGNVNIDNVPIRRSKKKRGFSGGEYVDYEEVK